MAALRPTWIEIDLAKLRANYQKLRSKVSPSTRILAVVKADAYGHGAPEVARALSRAGADAFGVSCVEEALILRQFGITGPILILGNAFPFEATFQAALEHRLSLTLSSVQGAQSLRAFLSGRSGRISVHLKMETGMQRIGARAATLLEMMRILAGEPKIDVQGLYTHLSSAKDANFTSTQIKEFEQGAQMLRQNGFIFKTIHAANSAAAIRYSNTHLDMIRPGIALYGGSPGFEPIASLKTRVIFLKKIPAGTAVSYERLFTAKRDSWIATVAAGYADGLPLAASKRAQMLVNGKRVPVAGLITMDMSMLDVTDAGEVRVGDEVTAIGGDGAGHIGPEEWAGWAKTSIYQIFCHLGGTRVPKVYANA